MKTLVTGAGGFVGRYIVEQLVARGDQVRTLARGDYPGLGALGCDVRRGDIRDMEFVDAACRGVDAVFHTAARAGIWGRWDDFFSVNVMGTLHVLRACTNNHVARLVYTSSPSVTFDGSDQLGVDESAAYSTKWLAHYPQTKWMAEQFVLDSHARDGLATCALRPHLVWGPRDGHLVPRLLKRARDGRLRQVGSGDNLIDITYVENAATAHLQAADALLSESGPGGKAYFISQGKPVKCWQWINELLRLAGLPPVEKRVSHTTAWAVGAFLEGIHRTLGLNREPRMTRFLAAQLATSHYFNISRARQDFGYEPEISTDEGMRRLAASWAAT